MMFRAVFMRSGKRYVFTYVLVCALIGMAMTPSAALCSVAPRMADQRLDQLNHTTFTERDGAPTGVFDMQQSPDGFLWIGTDSGLVRFDGVRFERDVFSALGHQPIYSIRTDGNGDIWVGFLHEGLARIHDGHVDVMHGNGLPGGTVFGLTRTPDGVLWALTSRGVGRLIDGRWQSINPSMGYTPKRPDGFTVTRDNALWISDSGRAFELKPGDKRFTEVNYDAFVQLDLQLAPGNPWRPQATDGAGLRDKAGANWIVVKQGIARYQWRGRGAPELEYFTHADGLTSNNVFGLYEDNDGDIWVWTDRGLDRFRGNRITPIPLPGSPTLPAMALDGDNGLWVGTQGNPLLHIVDGKVVQASNINDGATCLYLAPDKTLWSAGLHGVAALRDGHVQSIPAPAQLEHADGLDYQALAADSAGGLWMSVSRFGLFYWKDGQWQDKNPVPGHYATAPTRIVVDHRDRVWLTYVDNRLVIKDHAVDKTFSRKDGLDIDHAYALDVHADHAWVGGTNGVQLMRDGRFFRLQIAGDDALEGITGLVETASGELWTNGLGGIYRFSKADIDDVLKDPSHVSKPEHFDHTDGLDGQAAQLRPVPTLWAAPDGRVWATTNNGVFLIDPPRIHRNPIAPIPAVTLLSTGGKTYTVDRALDLPKMTQSLHLDYTAPSMEMPERIQFRYRLSRVDSNWQEAGTRRQAFYTNLAPSDYTFELLAANEDGVWSTQPAIVNFHIQAAWYQTSWFKLALAVVILALLALAYAARVRHAAERAEIRFNERERIARELHDTLLQSTQGLIYRLGSVLKNVSDAAPRVMLIDAMERAEDALVEARGRVGALRTDTQQTIDFIALIKSTINTILRGHDVSFHFHVIGSPRAIKANIAAELQTMSQEILSNALAHAEATCIDATIQFKRRCLIIQWRDNGKGIADNVLKDGRREGHWGLQGLRERAASIRSSVRICRHAEGGTQVIIRTPASQAYRANFFSRWIRRR